MITSSERRINEGSHAYGYHELEWLFFKVKQLTDLPIIRQIYHAKNAG
jgi:hypothetical protein